MKPNKIKYFINILLLMFWGKNLDILEEFFVKKNDGIEGILIHYSVNIFSIKKSIGYIVDPKISKPLNRFKQIIGLNKLKVL